MDTARQSCPDSSWCACVRVRAGRCVAPCIVSRRGLVGLPPQGSYGTFRHSHPPAALQNQPTPPPTPDPRTGTTVPSFCNDKNFTGMEPHRPQVWGLSPPSGTH